MKGMKQLLITTLVIPFTLLIPVMPAYGGEAMVENDEAAVKAVADAYIKATYEGDAETMEKLCHESAVMNGYLRGKPVRVWVMMPINLSIVLS